MLIDQLTPHLPKDNEEVNAQVKLLQAILYVATVVDPTLDRDDEAKGHELDHLQAMLDVIRSRDAHGQIKNQCQERQYLE
jgi:hypothetical protein